jgi:regulator of Ty1 transposition protein 109
MVSQTRSSIETGPVNNGAAEAKKVSSFDEPQTSSSLDAPADVPSASSGTVSAPESKQKSNEPPPFEHHPVGSSAELRSKGQAADASPFYWPEAGRGQVVVSDGDYQKLMNSLLDSFFDEKDILASTKAYVDLVACLADQLLWGKRIVGNSTPESSSTQSMQPSNLLDLGLVRKRKKPVPEEGQTATVEGEQSSSSAQDTSQGVNTLNASLVRKKKKT